MVSRPLHFLFDLDGVIIDSMPLHTESWTIYLERQGISADSLIERMHGKRNDQIVRDIFAGELSEELVFDHGARKEALFRELMAPRLQEFLVPGINEFLEHHQSRGLGLGSNAELANIDFVLDGAGIRRHFKSIADGHQVAHPKPAPDIYLLLANRFGASPADCIVFEDSATGVAAGVAAGMRVVGIATSEEHLEGVEIMVRDFRDPKLNLWLEGVSTD